ncbi:hypothetical protein OG21DRAFT_1048434 [Imleria badia]|nr:hypothetical protein OG21DRAFT_1048434 [Imleria badia]
MAMVDAKQLVLEDFIQEERLERLLSENYSLVVQPEHGAVYLQHNRWVHPSHKDLDC